VKGLVMLSHGFDERMAVPHVCSSKLSSHVSE
jgi:hypothetical protein